MIELFAASLVLAALAVLGLAILIARRFVFERSGRARSETEKLARRHYLNRVRTSDPAPLEGRIDAASRANAVAQLSSLLRGEDRARLLQVAEAEGVFAPALQQLASSRASRRCEGIRQLEQFGGEASVTALTEIMLADPSADVRLYAAGALARLESLPPLRDVLSSLSLHDRAASPLDRAVVRSVAGRELPFIQHMLRQELPARLRALLIEAIGCSGELAASGCLRDAASDRDPAVRAAAAQAACELRHPQSREWLPPLLDDPDRTVRSAAAEACGKLRIRTALPLLHERWADPCPFVRASTLEAVQRLSPAPAPEGA